MMIEGCLNRAVQIDSSDARSLRDRVSDLHTDMIIAGDLVSLVEHIVGEMQLNSDWANRQRAHACAALIGLEHYIAAIKDRLGAMGDELKSQ